MSGFNQYQSSHQKKCLQQGLSLVELLIALVLGVILVSAMTRVYLENKKNYIQDEELSRLQENSRFVLHVLKRELKMAGFLAGASSRLIPESVIPIANDCRKGWALNTSRAIDFFDQPANVKASVNGDSFSGCIKKPRNIQPGTDIISIKRSAGMPTINNAIYASSGSLSGEMKANSFYLERMGDGNPVLQYVGARFPSSVSVSLTNPALQISMWRYMAKVFYVRNYSVIEGDNIPALMMISLEDKTLTETSLVEGVEVFHIEFGIPSSTSNHTPVRFVTNPSSAQLAMASVIRVYLLMRTRNETIDYIDNKTYTLGSMPVITPGGHFMRRVFSTTIKIRNL